jgi:uncharacterized protein YlxP (DUF503 family)
MFVLALEVDLQVPASRSLKDKRRPVKAILDGGRHRFGVAAAEVAHHDLLQRAGLGFAVVAAEAGHCSDVIDEVERFVWSHPEIEVLAMERRWLE